MTKLASPAGSVHVNLPSGNCAKENLQPINSNSPISRELIFTLIFNFLNEFLSRVGGSALPNSRLHLTNTAYKCSQS